MKKFTLFLIVPLLFFGQNNDTNDIHTDSQVTGCIDLDETIIDIVSIFGDTSLLDGSIDSGEYIPKNVLQQYPSPIWCIWFLYFFTNLDTDLLLSSKTK